MLPELPHLEAIGEYFLADCGALQTLDCHASCESVVSVGHGFAAKCPALSTLDMSGFSALSASVPNGVASGSPKLLALSDGAVCRRPPKLPEMTVGGPDTMFVPGAYRRVAVESETARPSQPLTETLVTFFPSGRLRMEEDVPAPPTDFRRDASTRCVDHYVLTGTWLRTHEAAVKLHWAHRHSVVTFSLPGSEEPAAEEDGPLDVEGEARVSSPSELWIDGALFRRVTDPATGPGSPGILRGTPFARFPPTNESESVLLDGALRFV